MREVLGVNFQYLSNSTLADVRTIAPRLVNRPFDLIVFSGVLYHMYDPMQGLALIRSLVRTGGQVVIETAAALSDEHVGYFNALGANASDTHDYWTLSLPLLDYLLRYFRFKPLDCAYFPYEAPNGRQMVRVAIACLAMEQQLPAPEDQWMIAVMGQRDDETEYPNWDSPNSRELKYQGMFTDKPVYQTSGGIDLYKTVLQSTPVQITDNFCKLGLGDDC